MKAPSGDSTMHMVHLGCPKITDPDQKVIGICGTETEWIHGNPLKCPICIDMMFKALPCPMCGIPMNTVINP